MATESVHVSDVIPASAERIYRAWLDGVEHAAMTGGAATADSHVGGRFSAWDGYIRGTNVALEPGRRIVQAWRSADFPEGSPDSRLEILLEADPAGTRVTLIHSEIPEGQGADYEQGWRDHYFAPMRLYFTRSSGPAPVAEPAPPTIAPLEPAPLPPLPSLVSTMPRPAAIAMPPAEEWEEIETTVMKSPPVELIFPSEPKPAIKPAAAKKPAAKMPVKKAAAKKPAAKKPVAKKPVAKKPVAKKPVAKKPAAKKPAAKKPVKKAAARRSAAKKSAKPAKKAAPKKAPAKKRPAPKPTKKKGKR